MERKPLIRFENFGFQYFSQADPTLYDINLTIYEGEKVLIAGASGSGKSTLGHCLNGLIPFSYRGEMTGSLTIDGKETGKSSIFELSKSVGTVLQDTDGQFIGLTVGEDIAFALENDQIPQKEMIETVRKTAQLVNMDSFLEASPYELSGGQKQRVTFAGVMVDQVDVLLFDEPLANLDPAAGKKAVELIDRIAQKLHKTVIIIEHRLEDVLYRKVDRIVVMEKGRIAADQTPDELIASGLLPALGIREPLYASAIRYAGVPLTPRLHPGRLQTLDVGAIAEPLAAWDERQPGAVPPKPGPVILELEHVCFQYKKKRSVLEDVSFSIREGEMVSLVGTNGAGKSTLAKLICGFLKADAGKIRFRGEDLEEKTIRERSEFIGYVMQNPNQMICKPMIYDEVALGLRLRGVPEDQVKVQVERALQICGLDSFQKWPVAALSYGQKKRVTIASILVLQPAVIILDEPTAGQDYRHYTEIMEFLKGLNDKGVTILLITHDMHLMLEYTPHAIVLSDGRKIGDASAVDILTDEEITGKASLKVTSLYELARKAELPDPTGFVRRFISYERGRRES